MGIVTRYLVDGPKRKWQSAGGLTLLLTFLLVLPTASMAAKGGIPGPPAGDETSNNLSMPAVQTESVNSIPANWSTPTEPVLGVHYSYGCDKGESDGSFSYPNTSCVDSLSDPTVFYDATECTDAVMPSPCEGLPVDRIYWQKVDVNEWWADDDGISPDPGHVAYVDWGDALEAVSWSERSVIRVETQPYSSQIPDFDPVISCYDAAIAASLDPETACKVGFQMWHIGGQGINENWGVRADETAVSYNYDSPFQIIKTGNARLNLTKLAPGSATCPMPGGNSGDSSPLGEDGIWTGTEWQGTCTYSDEPYSVETSVGGKYVYGFNWRMKNVELDSHCAGWEKTGFWRLTFYAPEGDVMFSDPNAPNVAPPAVPSEVRTLPRGTDFNTVTVPAPEPVVVILAEEEEEDPTADDRLYRPVIDTENNLTYLDICIVGKTQGGGGGKPGGGKGKP
ncbi:hypothetical protein [Geopsychrobacter electrodiphilus]|uniref:hypothetical protein n=1 Tax=Geopsychrobacter electrodiphilus TaxID=225196 RepID=UPI00037DA5EF|nr:hypothetical protein [Geopsychrobacter electrodiphilus]